MSERDDIEILDGYVVDVACLRKYPQNERLARARVHTRNCALMGHCLESGYGLVSDDGHLALLDTEATPHVVDALKQIEHERGIKLRVTRQKDQHEMQTVRVEERS